MALNHRANRGNLNYMYNGIIYQYRIENKYYVGKTYGLERKRIDKHKYEALTLKSDRPFQRAIRKYGWENVLAGYSVIERISAETKTDKTKAARKPVVCLETGEEFDSVYDAAKHLFGEDAQKKKCRIQASLRDGWAVNGKHFKYI